MVSVLFDHRNRPALPGSALLELTTGNAPPSGHIFRRYRLHNLVVQDSKQFCLVLLLGLLREAHSNLQVTMASMQLRHASTSKATLIMKLQYDQFTCNVFYVFNIKLMVWGQMLTSVFRTRP